ncbi:MAG: HU family DNA-binding protein [Planctomycetaceae bacterium]|nr:HU family DNA-binding protein [Planctomycetaceae bacterium]
MAKKAAAPQKPMTKSEVLNALAEQTEMSRKDIATVFDALSELIGKNLGKRGPGVFNVPGLMKIKVVRKPATKASTRPSPFNPGEMMTVKAKPARNQVKVLPLKGLKDMV